MFEKLEAVEKRYEELTKLISDPEVIANQSEWQKLMKEHAEIQELVDEEVYNLLEEDAYKLFDERLLATIDAVREILDVPLTCNNWHWGGSRSNCGYRSKQCYIGAQRSYHKRGQAVDLISSQMTAKEMRDKLNFEVNELVDIRLVGDHIEVSKSKTRCLFCNSDNDIKYYKNYAMCKNCLDEMVEKFGK